jgi:hypothetical protein
MGGPGQTHVYKSLLVESGDGTGHGTAWLIRSHIDSVYSTQPTSRSNDMIAPLAVRPSDTFHTLAQGSERDTDPPESA